MDKASVFTEAAQKEDTWGEHLGRKASSPRRMPRKAFLNERRQEVLHSV